MISVILKVTASTLIPRGEKCFDLGKMLMNTRFEIKSCKAVVLNFRRKSMAWKTDWRRINFFLCVLRYVWFLFSKIAFGIIESIFLFGCSKTAIDIFFSITSYEQWHDWNVNKKCFAWLGLALRISSFSPITWNFFKKIFGKFWKK